jgi:hypothetical protein
MSQRGLAGRWVLGLAGWGVGTTFRSVFQHRDDRLEVKLHRAGTFTRYRATDQSRWRMPPP